MTAWLRQLRDVKTNVLVAIAALGLTSGTALWWTGHEQAADMAWAAATLPVLAGLVVQIISSLRRGDMGLDIIAGLSMSAGLAFEEPLAANVVAMMYAGGQLLEAFAQGRARREMTALMGRVARTAMVFRGSQLTETDITAIVPGDRLLIRHGEVLPVDGVVVSDSAVLDLSALTGESLPQRLERQAEALSGASSAGPPFELVATRPSAESTYAGIVRLVAAAEASKAPMMRMADRYALWFLALTLLLAGLAWLISEDKTRVLSVLVVATPCPLILAVPVAWIAGMSRAASMGVLVKGGDVLETMARIRTVVMDKTGTLTHGQAAISAIKAAPGFAADELLQLAASLDQASGHVVAKALIDAASARGLPLLTPQAMVETAGAGIEGRIGGRQVVIGGLGFVLEHCAEGVQEATGLAHASHAAMSVAVGVDGRLAGIITLDDPVRGDAATMLAALRTQGVAQIVLASGDRADVAERVGEALGLDQVLSALSPEQKVAAVQAAERPVMMVGDGVNDAPALAVADVGVAMGARGTVSSSEAAGVVLLVDELQPLVRAMQVARRSRRIAIESVAAGLGLSLAAMVAAAFGYLQPVEGALLQEAIDVAVILNALRALR